MGVARFAVVSVLACGLVSLLGRTVSDFDQPAEDNPHDTIRGIGAYTVALLVAGLDAVQERRRMRRATAHVRNPGPTPRG